MIESQGYLPYLHVELQKTIREIEEMLVLLQLNKSKKGKLLSSALQMAFLITSLPVSRMLDVDHF